MDNKMVQTTTRTNNSRKVESNEIPLMALTQYTAGLIVKRELKDLDRRKTNPIAQEIIDDSP